MLSLSSYLGGASVPPAHEKNAAVLLLAVAALENAYGKPFVQTSGYRSKEKHRSIYLAKGTPESKIPWGSAHLSGEAIDIADAKKELQAWCLANEPLLVSNSLFCEHFSATPTWVHFQTRAPKSGVRFFRP